MSILTRSIHCSVQTLLRPTGRHRFWAECNSSTSIVDHLMAHILDNLGRSLCFHDVAALAEDHLTLFVHHIVELQQLLADVKVAPFDLGLRLFQRFC